MPQLPTLYTLTEEQKDLVLKTWNARTESNPASILDILVAVFGTEKVERDKLDSRSQEGRAIKEFLASKSISPPKTYIYDPKHPYVLTDENKEWIKNNRRLSVTEITRAITGNQKLNHLSSPGRAIEIYINSLEKEAPLKKVDFELMGDYRPPGTMGKLVGRINRYVSKELDEDKLTPQEKKDCLALKGYLNAYSFVSQMNTYQSEKDRELFESTMIRTCYNKSDLTEEEVDQYCAYAGSCVIYQQISARIEQFQRVQDETMGSGDRPNMALIEAIDTLSKERNECFKRQEKLLLHLKGTRSDRLSKVRAETSSLLNLVAAWKHEETRVKLIQHAEERKKKLKDGIKEISDMDPLIASILGISEDEILN